MPRLKQQKTTEPQIVVLSALLGHLAMWSIRQSPYIVPDGLSEVLRNFHDSVCDRFICLSDADFKFNYFTPEQLEDLVNENLLSLKQVQDWNTAKNHNAEFVFISAFNQPLPDDDFIDIDALVRNTVQSVFAEIAEDDRKDNEIETAIAREQWMGLILPRLGKWSYAAERWLLWERIYINGHWTPLCRVRKRLAQRAAHHG